MCFCVCLQIAVVHVRVYRRGGWAASCWRSVSDHDDRVRQVDWQPSVRLQS